MAFLKKPTPRRAALRGVLGSLGVSVALPFLDAFLNDSGTALASGAPLPLRFGTWYWGCGHMPGQAVAERTTTGPGIEFLHECAPLKPFADKINFFSGFNTPLDGLSNYVHHSGWVACRTGIAPAVVGEIPGPTFDLRIADALGDGTRFRLLNLVSMGNPQASYSARNTYSRSAAEASPIGLYARVFGTDFVDPNSATFTPDPAVLVRQSVLSAVLDESKALQARVGAADRARLDEYFTSVRQVESQLALQLQKPAPSEACRVPRGLALEPPDDGTPSAFLEVETVRQTHEMMTALLVMALACNQTRIFNMVYSDAFSGLHKTGETNTHHTLTHEEETDPVLGYQPNTFWFNCRNMEGAAAFVEAFARVREGDGTLLDNTLIFANSESSFARIHSLNNLPMMTFGSGGGRLKTGLHVVGNGDPITRVALTVMRAAGLSIERWGQRSLETSKPITEILV
jgi:hypothetical protein